jgi:hypothetical protein
VFSTDGVPETAQEGSGPYFRLLGSTIIALGLEAALDLVGDCCARQADDETRIIKTAAARSSFLIKSPLG